MKRLDCFGYSPRERESLDKAILIAYNMVYMGLTPDDINIVFDTSSSSIYTLVHKYIPSYDPDLYSRFQDVIRTNEDNSRRSISTPNSEQLSCTDFQLNQATKFAEYLIKHKASKLTVAEHFGVSEATVHKYLGQYLKPNNPTLYSQVLQVKIRNRDSYASLTPLQREKCALAIKAVNLILSKGYSLYAVSDLLGVDSTYLGQYIYKFVPLKDYALYEEYLDYYLSKYGRRHTSDPRR